MHIQVAHRGLATGRAIGGRRGTCLLLLYIIFEVNYVYIYIIHTHAYIHT